MFMRNSHGENVHENIPFFCPQKFTFYDHQNFVTPSKIWQLIDVCELDLSFLGFFLPTCPQCVV